MTAIQQKRRKAYQRQLKLCGFRSWKRSNQRRCELIDREIDGTASLEEIRELAELQKLCDLYVKWKTNDQLWRANRRAKQTMSEMGKKTIERLAKFTKAIESSNHPRECNKVSRDVRRASARNAGKP